MSDLLNNAPELPFLSMLAGGRKGTLRSVSRLGPRVPFSFVWPSVKLGIDLTPTRTNVTERSALSIFPSSWSSAPGD